MRAHRDPRTRGPWQLNGTQTVLVAMTREIPATVVLWLLDVPRAFIVLPVVARPG